MIRIVGYFIAYASATLIAMAITMIGYWIGDRSPPSRTIGGPHVMGGDPRPGGEVIIEATVERLRNCFVKIERSFIDSRGVRHIFPDYDLENVGEMSPPPRIVRIAFTIPPTASTGNGKYNVTLAYGCNPLQRAIWPIVIQQPPVVVNVKK